jgi:Histidine kinase
MEKLNDKWLRIIGIPAASIIATTLFSVIHLDSFRLVFKSYIFGLIHATVLWETGRLYILTIRNRFPRIEQVYVRFLITLFFTILNTCIVSFIFSFMAEKTFYFERQLFYKDYWKTIAIATSATITLTIIYEIIYLFKKWKQAWLENIWLKRDKIQTQVDSLKTQVSPHFLFQSLNSLSLLVDEDKKRAVRFVDELSHVYRYFLQNHEKETITLGEEIRFANAYFDIIKTRFGEGIHFKMNISEKLNAWLVPPMTIKTFVENAVSLNKVSKMAPLSMFFFTDLKNNLVVNHNVQSKTLLLKRKRLGLINLSVKYKMLTNKELEITENDKEFEIKLPLIKAD